MDSEKEASASASVEERASEPEASAGAALKDAQRAFQQIAGEWSSIVAAIQDLKRELEPEDFREALEAAGLAVKPRAPSPVPEPSSGEPQPRQPPPSATARSPRPAKVPATPKERPVPQDEASIHGKLEELLKLLKDKVEARDPHKEPPALSIPKDVTREIAREIAGQVKESVLATIQAASPRGAPEPPAAPQHGPVKRISLDDVAGIIDQITGTSRAP